MDSKVVVKLLWYNMDSKIVVVQQHGFQRDLCVYSKRKSRSRNETGAWKNKLQVAELKSMTKPDQTYFLSFKG